MVNDLVPGDRSVGYLFWRVSTAANWVLVGLAGGCLCAEIAIWGLSFTLDVPSWVFAPFFAFAIFANFAGILITATTHGVKSVRDLSRFGHLPAWSIGVLIVIGAGFIVSGFGQLISQNPGQPGYNASTKQYYYDDHGSIIPTDREHYLSAVAIQTRGFLSFAIVFTCLALLACGAEAARRGAIVIPALSPVRDRRRPRLCPPVGIGITIAALGAVVFVIPILHIVQRVDAYASNPPPITTTGITQRLDAGPWVVFTWCEMHATDAPYSCPKMVSTDIVIRSTNGSDVQTNLDPSTDHVSPDGLPAAGQLTFRIDKSGDYHLSLTRRVPKGVFVAQSPGSVARGLAADIAIGIVGLAALALGLVLFARWVLWYYKGAPRVLIPRQVR
jgi:hypothetical protein